MIEQKINELINCTFFYFLFWISTTFEDNLIQEMGNIIKLSNIE